MNNKDNIMLLESTIKQIVSEILTEKKRKKKRKKKVKKLDKSKRGEDSVEGSKSYKRQYKAVEDMMDDPRINKTQVMSKALGVDLTDDDAARSHMFKKLHKEKTPDKSGTYEFNDDEISAIFSQLK